jgi:hypothetical protein
VGAGVVAVGWAGLAAGVDEGLVHVEDEDVPALGCPLSDVVGDEEDFLCGKPLADVVFELNGAGGTVVKKRNCIRMPSSTIGDAFSENRRRPADITAYLMNISRISSENII